MFSIVSSFTKSAVFYQEFYGTLMTLAEQILAADSATIVSWLQTGYVIFATACFGLFPLVSLLLAAITLLVLPILCHGQGRDRLTTLLGLGDVRTPHDLGTLESHLAAIRDDLPRNLVVLLAIGLVPFLGAAAGVIYYRLSPVAALRGSIESATLGPLRWILPLVALTLVAIQPIPVVGPLSLPLLYATYHGVYDTILRRRFGARDALPVAA